MGNIFGFPEKYGNSFSVINNELNQMLHDEL